MEGAQTTEARKSRTDAEASQQFSAAAVDHLSARSTHISPLAFETSI